MTMADQSLAPQGVPPVDVAQFAGRLRRINPFYGMMVDAAVWRDAHEYHRQQLRLHNLALHGWGIVQGLGVAALLGENVLLVEPGVAIDPAGNSIVVGDTLRIQLTDDQAGMVYVLLQFRETLTGPTQTGVDGVGQPTRVVEGFRVLAVNEPPAEPYVELARVQLQPGPTHVHAPHDPNGPEANELDLRFRPRAGGLLPADAAFEAGTATGIPASIAFAGALARAVPDRVVVAMGSHKTAGWDRHRDGVKYLAREVEAAGRRPVHVIEGTPAIADQVDMLYLTGHAALDLNDAEVAGAQRVMEQGGLVVGEGCQAGPAGPEGARAFAQSFFQLAGRLNRTLTKVDRGHPLLVARHVFAQAPTGGRKSTRVMEGGGMVYCDADYGCAWQGGAADTPLARWSIRDALEFGVNLAMYRQVRAETA